MTAVSSGEDASARFGAARIGRRPYGVGRCHIPGENSMNLAQPALALADIDGSTVLVYIAALVISGLSLLLVSALPIGTPKETRVINALLAVLMLGYAAYLMTTGPGDSVFIFWYVFVLPIVLVYRTFKAAKANREAKRQAATQQATAAFQSPVQGQPVQGQPGAAPSGAYYPPA